MSGARARRRWSGAALVGVAVLVTVPSLGAAVLVALVAGRLVEGAALPGGLVGPAIVTVVLDLAALGAALSAARSGGRRAGAALLLAAAVASTAGLLALL